VSIKVARYLIDEYFKNTSFASNATSSHWAKYSRYQKINHKISYTKIEEIRLSGFGFGDFKSQGVINFFINLPTQIYLKKNVFPKCDRRTLKLARKNAKKSKQLFSHDLARMVLTLDFLEKFIPDLNEKRVVIIGDGYGRLGTLIKAKFPKSKITYINLGRTLLFDLVYSKKTFPNSVVHLVDNEPNLSADFNFIEAEKVNQMQVVGDLFINIASMQEMNYSQIQEYFKIIQNQAPNTMFYCCNRESKKLPDGSVIEFRKYPWGPLKQLLEEYCPWHQEFPMNRPPFKGKVDGPILHSMSLVESKPQL
jgi:hypothetical protein